MKHLLFLSLFLTCGCSSSITQEKSNSETQNGTVHSVAPVIIEARIIECIGCDKYCVYNIELINVIKNSIGAKLDSHIKIARLSWENQPELNKVYTLELCYYNDERPAYWFKILKFKEK